MGAEEGNFPPPRYTSRLIDRLRGKKKEELPPPPPPPLSPPSLPLRPAPSHSPSPSDEDSIPRNQILPFWGNFYPGISDGPSYQERERERENAERRERELAPVKEILKEAAGLQKRASEVEQHSADAVAQMARTLHAREYRAPQRAVACGEEKSACVDCYGSSLQDPLKCAEVVRAFQDCAKKAHEEFVKSTSPQ